jgi:hypothetical protein
MVVPVFGISISYETVFILNFFDPPRQYRRIRGRCKHDLGQKGKAVREDRFFPIYAAYRERPSDPANRAADCEVNRLNPILSYLSAHWLSLLLIAGLIVAIWYVYKHKNKYAKNEFE